MARSTLGPSAPAPEAGGFDGWLLTPVPLVRVAALRILVVGYAVGFLVARWPGLVQVTELPGDRFDPVGVLGWMGSPVAPGVAQVLLAATIALGVAALVGWRWRLTGPAFAVAFLLVATYRVSFGHVLHTDHLVAVHLLVLAAAPAAAAWSVDGRRGPRAPRPAGGSEAALRAGWVVRVMAVATVVSYVLAGVAKLRNGGVDWLTGDVLRNQVAYDNLRKELLGDIHSPIGGWAVGVPVVFGVLSVATVAVELGAPVALLGGRARTIWVAAAWGFHVGIVALMAISFPYQLLGIAYAPFFAVERVVGPARAWVLRRVAPRGGGHDP